MYAERHIRSYSGAASLGKGVVFRSDYEEHISYKKCRLPRQRGVELPHRPDCLPRPRCNEGFDAGAHGGTSSGQTLALREEHGGELTAPANESLEAEALPVRLRRKKRSRSGRIASTAGGSLSSLASRRSALAQGAPVALAESRA